MRLPSDVAALAWEAADTSVADRILQRAYRQTVDEFHQALQETGAYQAAMQRALRGEPREEVRAYLAGYMAGYLRERGTRTLRTSETFQDAYRNGFEQGGRDQLTAWGEDGSRFALRDRQSLTRIRQASGAMAGAAMFTLDDHLLDQAASSAARGDESPNLDGTTLAATSAMLIPNRGYNEGRATTAERSVQGRIMKRWSVLGTALEPRPHHAAIEGQTIHYHDLFSLGMVEVMWPHDWERAGPAEWTGCRHFAEYLPAEGAGIEPWWGENVGARDQPVV